MLINLLLLGAGRKAWPVDPICSEPVRLELLKPPRLRSRTNNVLVDIASPTVNKLFLNATCEELGDALAEALLLTRIACRLVLIVCL